MPSVDRESESLLNISDNGYQKVSGLGLLLTTISPLKQAENNSASKMQSHTYFRHEDHFNSSDLQSLNDSTEIKLTSRQLEAEIKIPNGSSNTNLIGKPCSKLRN